MDEEVGVDVRVISIGAMAAHPLRAERAPVRTGHATTTLIRAGDATIVVDPGLPAAALEARLGERVGLAPGEVTHVFLTSFHPDVHRGIDLFEDADWLVAGEEREAVGVPLAQKLRDLAGRTLTPDEASLRRALERDVGILQRCDPAPEELAPGVALFPLPGVTPGLCGLLLELPRFTTLLCGDAIPSLEHLEQGKVVPWAMDVDAARRSFEEAIEVADLLILGRDNLVVNPTKRPF